MKQFLIAATLLASLSTFAQSTPPPAGASSAPPAQVAVPSSLVIDEAPDRASPIMFKIVSAYYGQLSDDQGHARMVVSSGSISIMNSAGAKINTYSLTEAEAAKLKLIFSKVSEKCPVNVIVDRETRTVRRITPSCDELSALPSEENLG